MKLTFCPVNLPDNQDILTQEFETDYDIAYEMFELLSDESKKHEFFVAVIWEERKETTQSFGEYFQICVQPHQTAAHTYRSIWSIYDKVENLNIFCFSTFEEAFDYAKDYCQGVWAGTED